MKRWRNSRCESTSASNLSVSRRPGSLDHPPLNVVVIPHRCKSSRIGGGEGSELWAATGKWSGDGRDSQIVNHPPFVPPTLIIDHEKPRDVGEDGDERPHIIGIRRQTGLGLERSRGKTSFGVSLCG
jgi:hypothetical protein